MAGSKKISDICDMVEQILALASSNAINIYADYRPSASKSEFITQSTFLGDPNRFMRGVETQKITAISLSSNYLTFLTAVMAKLGFATAEDLQTTIAGKEDSESGVYKQVIEETKYDYKEDSLVAIPLSKVTTTFCPVLRVLDFSCSQTYDLEVRPRYFFKNLDSSAQGYWGDILHMFVRWIFQNVDTQDIIWFMFAGKGTVSYTMICAMCDNEGKPHPDQSLYQTAAQLGKKTRLVGNAADFIGNQINHGVGFDILAAARFENNTATLASQVLEVLTMSSLNNALQTITATISNDTLSGVHSSHLTHVEIVNYGYDDAEETSADVSLVHVVTHAYSLASNGTAQQESHKEELVEAERVVVVMQPITTQVTSESSIAPSSSSNSKVSKINIQIPTTNWNDVSALKNAMPGNVTQVSNARLAVYDNVNEAINVFKQLAQKPEVKSTRVQYTPSNMRCSIEYSFTK